MRYTIEVSDFLDQIYLLAANYAKKPVEVLFQDTINEYVKSILSSESAGKLIK